MRSYADLSCLSPPPPEWLGPLCAGLLQPRYLEAARASTNPAVQKRRNVQIKLCFQNENKYLRQSSCVSVNGSFPSDSPLNYSPAVHRVCSIGLVSARAQA